ncbi:cell division protein ZapA [Ligilactobacillus ceti]|uniref:Cell division protein ZapA n=1 Tax=Ligilactobacillus ceti DSM 22408 TaxID=1122146 RepID=A0A0R2KNP3_9LACO|nr:cell division protein ZapA [Ligilactobacillus ceti]KRN89029.1 hypothetical protein IV53_GL001002 [Ligilactobacillus ceti DSM 22408]
MNNKRRFKVKIDGLEYIIIGKSTPPHMDAVVEIIEHQLKQVREIDATISKERAAMLIAVNAVSDQLKMQEKIDELTKQLAVSACDENPKEEA